MEFSRPPDHCLLLVIEGRVQGVGYRPFVYRQAQRHHITGWVRNRTGRVEIQAQGEPRALEAFVAALTTEAPPLSAPRLVAREACTPRSEPGFAILESEHGAAHIHVPPDSFACPDCIGEMHDPNDRRYRYPFINCTQCGPRYTLIARLPYDRPNTSMADFPLCDACRTEYENPADRRFHAQPVACPRCGPRLRFEGADGSRPLEAEAALRACVQALREGAVVAVKGIGGYHLMCDARADTAVERLRARKRRPDKPLAVLFAQEGRDAVAAVREALDPSEAQAELLRSPARPIVLLAKRADPSHPLSRLIAPGLNEVGAMLPYSPLHHLLVEEFGGPLVATSGNISGEPVITDPRQARERLARLVDAFLHHDRPILRPADDAVIRFGSGKPRPIRLGRGNAPLEFDLPVRAPEPLLAVGGHMKNSVALAWDDRLIVSPHIGDLDAPRSREVFAQVIADLQRLYGVAARRILCDAHPDYASSRWARAAGRPVTPVFHHHAHASALYGEHWRGEAGPDWLVFAWDGVGLGQDGTLWGGETLLGRPGAWRRVGSFRPFRLPGGDKAGREPWRAALALCWEAGVAWRPDGEAIDLLRHAWERRINCPQSTAAGRLFDAAAALTGVTLRASFEGQGPMQLEAVAQADAEAVELPLQVDEADLLRCDWSPLLPLLLDPRTPVARRAGRFHATLAQCILRQAQQARAAQGVTDVGLTGGVFQNRLLCELAAARLEGAGFRVWQSRRVPCNDGGISFGQIIEWLFAGPSAG